MEVFKYNDVMGGIVNRRPDGLVDVDFAGTILTLPESDNELTTSSKEMPSEYKTGGEIKSSSPDLYENNNFQIRMVGGDPTYYKRVNGEWKFLSAPELAELKTGTKHELEHRSTIEAFKRGNMPTEIVASFIAWDHIQETQDYYSRLEKAIPEEMAKGNLIKRADGTYSERGLWDNIRDNAGSGKEPTPEMLEQERKIKAKYDDGGGVGSANEDQKKQLAEMIKTEMQSADFHKKIVIGWEEEIKTATEQSKLLWEKYQSLTYPLNQDVLEEYYKSERKRKELEAPLNFAKNVIKCLENKGKVVGFTDKKDVQHTLISDWRDVPTDNIMFKEESILVDPVPVFIPIFDEDQLKRRAFIMDAIRIEPNSYMVSTTKYDDEKKPSFYSQFVIVTLDQLVLISDYYYKKVRATLQAEADNKNLRNEEYYDKLPEAQRERVFNQRNYYSVLPVSVKKKINQQDWEALDLAGKEKLYKPFKRYNAKRITSSLEENNMYGSFHKMYERFLNPEAVVQYGKSKMDKYAHPEVWSYWSSFREMMDFKIKDIRTQREYLNEAYATAVETSFGESNTSTILKENYGVLVKRQNGDKINAEEVRQVEDALIKIYSCFGNCRKMAIKDNLKISHTGIRLVFGSKAVGIYHSKMHTISSSNKYGNDQFQMTMAHEFGHFIDNFIGMSQGKMFISGEYEGIAGRIAIEFRNNMNKPKSQQNDYINSTQECFARAMEQYFTLEELGENAGLSFSYKQLDKVVPISNADDFVPLEKFDKIIRPLIVKFFDEFKDIFDHTIDVSEPTTPMSIEPTDLPSVESTETRSTPKSDTGGEIKDIEDALRGLEAYLPFATGTEKSDVADAIKGLKALHKMMKSEPTPATPEPQPSPTPKRGERNYLQEAKDYFLDAGFIEEMDTDEQHFVMELIKAIDVPYRTKGEIEAEEYFITNQMADQLTTDKKFYVEKLVENSKKKPSQKTETTPTFTEKTEQVKEVKKVDGEPSDPAYLMTIDEYKEKVTPLIKEYRKWQKKNEQWFVPVDYNGLLVMDLREVIEMLNSGIELGHFYIHKAEKWEATKTPEEQARYWFSYYKTRNFDKNFDTEPTPQKILDEKQDFMDKFSQFFTQEEIESKIERDELNSPKRSIRRAIDNGTYKKLLQENAVTLDQLEQVAGSVGVRLPKSIFDKSTQNQMDYEKKLDELMRNLPTKSVDQMNKMIDMILKEAEPLSVQIYESEMARLTTIIQQIYEKQKIKIEVLQMNLGFPPNEVFTYSTSSERTLGQREDIVYAENIRLVQDWKLNLSKIVKEYVEYLKYKMILAFIENFQKITLPIASITKIDLGLQNDGFYGEFRFDFDNGSSFVFKFRSVKAGGYNIQRLHFRYISDFSDVKLADGSKGGTSLYQIISNFSKKSE